MSKEVKPLSPKDIIGTLDKIIPNVVIEAVNNLLKKEFRGSSVEILQKDIISEIKKLDSTIITKQIDENHWLDFEDIFRKNGWIVTYDKPGYNETYESSFKFTPKRKK